MGAESDEDSFVRGIVVVDLGMEVVRVCVVMGGLLIRCFTITDNFRARIKPIEV